MTEEERDALLLAFEAGRRVGLEEAAKLCGRAFGAPFRPTDVGLSGLVDIPDLVQAIRDLKD
jgi:hypothetical protein